LKAIIDCGYEVPAAPGADTSFATILVIEDSPDEAAILKTMFRRSRILNPIQAVDSVFDALCYLKGQGAYSDRKAYPFPALLLIDLHLRDGSGFDILRWFQGNKVQSPLALVVLSGSDVHAFKQAYDLGADSFLTKPLRFEDFENMVQHVRGIKLTSTPEGHFLEVDS
jgi:two-component system response regulator